MEKPKPHYDLKIIKEFFCSVSTRKITQKAQENAAALGYMGEDEMIAVINRLQAEHFYKSMTSYQNHKIWQDVYRYQDDNAIQLYIKLQLSVDRQKAVLIQMKKDERNDE